MQGGAVPKKYFQGNPLSPNPNQMYSAVLTNQMIHPSSHPGVMPVATTAAQDKKSALSMAAAHDENDESAFSNFFWTTYGMRKPKEI